MRFEIDCLKCGKTLKCPLRAVGKTVKCPKCGSEMVAEPFAGAMGALPVEAKPATAMESPAPASAAVAAPPVTTVPANSPQPPKLHHGHRGRHRRQPYLKRLWNTKVRGAALLAIILLAWFVGTQTAWILKRETKPVTPTIQETSPTQSTPPEKMDRKPSEKGDRKLNEEKPSK